MGTEAQARQVPGSAPRLAVPRGKKVDVLRHIATRKLYEQLQNAPSPEWPRILAETQVAAYHVGALAGGVGLRVTERDLAELRRVAAGAIDGRDLTAASSMSQLVEEAGSAMREAVAWQLALRCRQGGSGLQRRVTGGVLPDPSLPCLTAEDWHALIVEKWRVLPVLTPRSLAAFLLTRLQSREAGRDTIDAPAGIRLEEPLAGIAA
jgi:hypothetical protein